MATDLPHILEYLRTFSIFVIVDQPNNRQAFQPPK